MRRNLVIIFFFLVSGLTLSQTPRALNNLTLPDTLENYSFLVSGHFHGSSQNISGYPAASLLANLDLINNSRSAFMCSTGDLFLDVRNNIPQYQRALFNKLKIPLYNAVGNHDISGNVYQENFGNTWFLFQRGNELFVFLDTEENDGSIKGDQLGFLKKGLEHYCNAGLVKNVMIFSHRPIWSENHPQLKSLFKENTKSDFGNNYNSDVLPLIKKYSQNISFYWFAGSLGAEAPASFFYRKETGHLYYIQSAIRDLPRDGLLKVNVNRGKITFKTISLTNEKMPALESCNIDMWKRAPVAGFNYRLVPLYIKQMVMHRYFWYGIGYTLLSFVVLYFIRKKIKRKKIA